MWQPYSRSTFAAYFSPFFTVIHTSAGRMKELVENDRFYLFQPIPRTPVYIRYIQAKKAFLHLSQLPCYKPVPAHLYISDASNRNAEFSKLRYTLDRYLFEIPLPFFIFPFIVHSLPLLIFWCALGNSNPLFYKASEISEISFSPLFLPSFCNISAFK